MLIISWSKAVIVPKECQSIGASSGTASLFLLKRYKINNVNQEVYYRQAFFNIHFIYSQDGSNLLKCESEKHSNLHNFFSKGKG